MQLTELKFLLEDLLVYCQSKNGSLKTLSSYEQSNKLFINYLQHEHEVEEPGKVKKGHIRQVHQVSAGKREVYSRRK